MPMSTCTNLSHNLTTAALALALLSSCNEQNASVGSVEASAPPTVEDAATNAFDVAVEYVQWLELRSELPGQDAATSEDWVGRLECAANDASGSEAGLACRTQLVALLNDLGRNRASEEQILRRIEETPDPATASYWIAELAEARLRRLTDPEDGEVDPGESIALFYWAGEELEAGLAGAESLEAWQGSIGHRQLWILLSYGELVRLGVLEPDAALPHLHRGFELSVAWLDTGYRRDGLLPVDFAHGLLGLELARSPLDPAGLERNFDLLAQHEQDSDRLTQARLQLLMARHGQGTLAFARELEAWVAGHGVEGPNAHLAVLHAARAYLALERYEDVLRQVEPHLTLEPKWTGELFHQAWIHMQVQNALAYTAAADALEDDVARRLGVAYLLAVDPAPLDGEPAALDKARRFAAEQRGL